MCKDNKLYLDFKVNRNEIKGIIVVFITISLSDWDEFRKKKENIIIEKYRKKRGKIGFEICCTTENDGNSCYFFG